MKTFEESEELLQELNKEPSLYNDSQVYNHQDWKHLEDCTLKFPIQRKLGKYECVFDLDDVSEWNIQMIPKWLKEIGFKFIAWQSGTYGLHIHFWINIYGKEAKKKAVELMAKNIEEKFGVKNDLGPMGHGHIRAEFSVHPTKGYRKTHILTNLSTLFYINELSHSMRKKVSNLTSYEPLSTHNSVSKDGKVPKCIRYMQSNMFSDGRERIIFSLISFYKASGLDEHEILTKIQNWCNNQNYSISDGQILSKIKSSQGQVGCRFRHTLLEELGHDIGECDWK